MSTLDKILELLKQKGITDQDFIKAIGLNTRNLVTDWKVGKTNSYRKYIPEISEFFHVSADYLLGIQSSGNYPEDVEQLIAVYAKLDQDSKEKVREYAQLLEQKNSKE